MSTFKNLELFLTNYFHTKKISWLELFIFEYCKHKEHSEELLSSIQGNDKFMALPFHMSYHLLKLLFSTICELMTSNHTGDNNAVLCLRKFLTNGLGSRIITMMSTDLDLSNVTNERELVIVLTKVFPTECWGSDWEKSHLRAVPRNDVVKLYKVLWLLDPKKVCEVTEIQSAKKSSNDLIPNFDESESKDCEEFFTDEYNKRNETMQLSPSQLAQKVIEILKKLVVVENATALGQTDQNSVTMCCLHFSLDTLNHLQDQKIFSENDQTVIKVNLMELTFLCFNNLVNRDGKSIEPMFKKLFHLLELSDQNEISCGLILNILTILNNLCVKKSIQKTENLKMFVLCNHLILKQMEVLSCDKELLHVIHLQLIRIIKNVQEAHRIRFCDNKKPKKRRKDVKSTHHDSLADGCIFERLLIDSFPLIKSYAKLKTVLKYLRANGVCCCNGNIETIRIFMRPSTIPTQFLGFLQDRVIQPMFDKERICVFCNDKLFSGAFKEDYCQLLGSELQKREGWELHSLLHHLIAIQKMFSRDFLHKFTFNVIVPTFKEEKMKFLENPEEFCESKLIVTSCLTIFNESMKEKSAMTQFFNSAMINHLKDCSLVPAMSSNACQLLKLAVDNIKLLGADEDQRENIAELINGTLFSNILYLTHELMGIYGEIGLPKNIPITSSKDVSDRALDKSADETSDFEILDEKTVEVKEPQSDMDVLLLNTIHWNIICDLITKDTAFQHDFVGNIYNNFSGNVLFTIAYNALNSILLKKELKNFQLRVISPEPRMNNEDLPAIFERCEFRTPAIISDYDVDYEAHLQRFYHFFEISESFLDKLRKIQDFSLIYRPKRDKNIKVRALVHKDVFLTDNVCDNPTRQHQIAEDHFYFYHNWLNQIWIGIFEGKAIRDRFIKIVNRFVRTEEELKAIHRVNTIKDITGRCGVKYLSSIARNCFDICWRLSDNISFTEKMSAALEELKLLLLQDNWDENKEAMVDALQLLLGVAEMKTTSVSRMMFMDPENHLSCSNESIFSDFNSSHEQVERSDDENSSEKKTETYFTADENYDGDEECLANVDTEGSQSFRTSSLPAAVGFRNTNEHICKLVVEILMDLSKRCVERPDQWQPDVLISLAQRLSCMKTYLGGSEFLLKGFSKILQSNSPSLIGLQKTILELIEDLNTPDSFKAFLSILTESNAAIDLIMSRLETLCNNETSPRPFMKVNFPTFSSDGNVISTCDTHLHRLILSFQNVHLSNKLLTPFTESSLIIPLNYLDFTPWSNNVGFTVSTWVQIEPTDDEKLSAHLVSLGTEKLMMTIYVNSDGSFTILVTKPNQNFSKTTSKIAKPQPGTSGASNKENVNKSNILGIALATINETELPNIRTRGFLKSGMKKSVGEEEAARRLQTSKVSVKSKRVKVKSDRWSQVCFSARSSDNEIMLLMTVNGTEQELIEIPIDGMRESDVNGMLQLLCIGAQNVKKNEPSALKYSISNVMLFKSPLESPAQTSHLFSLGPDCDSLIECEAVQSKSLLGILDFSKIANKPVAKVGSKEFSKRLKSNVLVIYSASKTSAAIGYKTSDHGKPLEMFINGKIPQSSAVPSLARSIQLSGGLSTLLFLFARTVEMTEDPTTQSNALYVFLKMSYGNNHLYSEFHQKSLFNLVAHVFKHSVCYRGPGMLKAILDVIYGGTMFNRRSKTDDFQINERSELNIQNPKLLLKLLQNFNIFQSPEKNETSILDLLFKSLKVVVRNNHPYKNLNCQCLADHDFYENLIEFCKIHLANSANSIAISPTTAVILVELLKMLSKDTPTMWNMNEIQKLLLLMHHPSESFVTHDRTKFHFILPGNKPQKLSKLSLASAKSSKYFNFSIKIRSTSGNAASPRSANSPPRTPRSPNDSTFMLNEQSTSTKSLKNVVVSPPNRKVPARKFDELSENQTKRIAKALADERIRRELKPQSKAHVRRLHHTPKRSPFKKFQTTKRKQKEEHLTQEDELLVETFKSLMSAGSLSSIASDVEVNRYETGISVLQENLFMMLKDSVILLDDLKAEMSLPDCLKIEMLIMFANHHDGNVRASIIELVHAVTSRESAEIVSRYEKSNFWTHLGNQLAISRVNMRMVQACVDWICLEKVLVQDLSRSQKFQMKYKPAFNVLIAMLPSMVHDAQVTACATKFLRLILETHPECIMSTMLNSLITSSIKALIKVKPQQERAKDALLMLLEQIASRSLTSSGSIQTLWDLLYGLSFVERHRKHEIIRFVHVSILKQLISLCLIEQSRRGSRAGVANYPLLVVTQTLGTLPHSEIKTRFHLIHDRAIHFVNTWDGSDELTPCEIDFVKYLIDLHFSGIHQGSSLLLWSLNPTGSEEIKIFTIRKLSNVLLHDANFVLPGNDTKLVKSLLIQYLNANASTVVGDEGLQTVSKFCGISASQQQQNWNWSLSAVEKIEMIRQSSTKDQNASIEKIVYKLEPLVQICIDSAMKMTRNVIDIQNKERRHLMNQLKKSQEIDFYREWFELVQRMIHEDAPWHNQHLYPSTWELDETEGPGRTRIRLKRSVLNIEKRFFVDEFQLKATYQHRKPLLDYLLRPKETQKYSIQDRIVFTFNGKHLTLELEFEGEIIITDHQLIFLANVDTYINSIICSVKDISEVWDRRYQHKEIALEIFLVTRKTFFIIFETNYERDIVKKFVSDKIEKTNAQKSDNITQRWVEKRITNYEYLIELNKIAGRSYNDLMQYPVFPWILTNYDTEILDLKSAETFRKLNKTISTQHEDMEEHYVSNYKYLAQSMAEHQTIMKPYHYSSHYSNSGTVLHFLVRLPPFTSMFLLYQDHNFDIPDRTFHSMATTFRLTSKESATDVKELIPEFFYLFDFLENSEGFNFGKRQSGDQVNDVKLPPWCGGSARLFMFIHRQALECDIVRKQLHHWIDLIFGFKQKGNAAVAAINVFHPATYPEFQITNITEPVERSAYETMIRTYGQMPKQIFTSAHKKSSSLNENIPEARPVLKGVKGLRWGVYTGSPQLPKPSRIDSLKCRSRISRLVLIEDSNMFYGLPEKCHLMRASKSENNDLVLWSEGDGVIRVKSLKDANEKTGKLFHIPSNDPVTACGSHVKYSNLWFGHESGNISVYVRTDEKLPATQKQKNSRPFNDALESIIGIKEIGATNGADEDEPVMTSKWNYPIVLVKHRGEVLDLKICVEFKIVVSIGSDGRTAIWDAQKIEYIRTIEPSCNTLNSQLTLVDVSSTLGDILTVFSPSNEVNAATDEESFEVTENGSGDDFINVSMAITGKSQLRLHTINAKYIKHALADGFVTAACFSFIKEGTGVNVIAVGFDDGVIRLYSTWTLDMIRELATGVNCEISEIIYTSHQHLTFLADQEIQVWESEGLNGEPPKFHSVVLY